MVLKSSSIILAVALVAHSIVEASFAWQAPGVYFRIILN